MLGAERMCKGVPSVCAGEMWSSSATRMSVRAACDGSDASAHQPARRAHRCIAFGRLELVAHYYNA